MNKNRSAETGPVPYRTGRYFCVDSKWYFSTREGLDHGPFAKKEMAIDACKMYIGVCLQVEKRHEAYTPTRSKPDFF